MSRTSLLNGAAVVAALLASVAAAGPRPLRSKGSARIGTVTDATGIRLQAGSYDRIASASTVADRLAVELCGADRIVAFTAASASGLDAERYATGATIESIDDVEHIAGLRPDLVLVHNVADRRRVERLRDVGLTVFDLGPLQGLRTLADDVRQVGALCGEEERAVAYLARFERRLRTIANGIAAVDRRGAIYLSIYGDRFFGGTRGTSYHDVLEAAGLDDVAAERHTGWPQYSVEQILELDPDIVVTRRGMRDAICAHPVLQRLRACVAGFVEIAGDRLDAPGPGMLDAAEAVHAAVYR